MIKRSLTFGFNLLGLALAGALVLVAVLVTLARLMLPHIDRYREPLSDWVSMQFEQPVEFDRIRAEWHSLTPSVELDNFRLLDAPNGKILTRFERARLTIDFRESLRTRSFKPGRLTVSGLRVALTRESDGSIRISGASGKSDAAQETAQRNALIELLQSQRHLVVESAALEWDDQQTLIKPVVFSNIALKMQNDGELHRIEGTARLPDHPQARFRFLFDASGDLVSSTWSGKLYFEAAEIAPTVLLEYSHLSGLEIRDGYLNLRTWSEWSNAKVQRVISHFDAKEITVGTHAQRILLKSASAQLEARQSSRHHWDIAANNVQISTSNGSWPETRAIMRVEKDADGLRKLLTHLQFVRVADLLPLLSDLALIPPNLQPAIRQLQPTADLQQLQIGYFPRAEAPERLHIRTDFSGLHWQMPAGIPPLHIMDGKAEFTSHYGHLHLHTDTTQNLPSADPLAGQTALATNGTMTWRRQEDGWALHSDKLVLQLNALSAQINGGVQLSEQASPLMDIQANLSSINIADLNKHLSDLPVGGKLSAWVNAHVSAGLISGTQLLWRGTMADFPYQQHQGTFLISAQFNGVDSLFHHKWPPMHQAQGQLQFDGTAVNILVSQARSVDTQITDAKLVIADVREQPPLLKIHGQVEGDARQALDYLHASHLKDKLANRLEPLRLTGDNVKLDLQLDIPLVKGSDTGYSGELSVRNLQAAPTGTQIVVQKIAGKIQFDKQQVTASALTGEYEGRPVELGFSGNREHGQASLTVQADLNGGRDFLAAEIRKYTPDQQLPPGAEKFLQRLSGETRWRIEIQGVQEKNFSLRQLALTSDLTGMAIALPSPLHKIESEPRAFSAIVESLQAEPRMVKIQLGEVRALATLVLKEAPPQRELQSLAVALGGTPASGVTHGVQLNGRLGALKLNEWLELMPAQPTAAPVARATELPVRFDIFTDQLEAIGREFNEVQLTGDNSNGVWSVQLQSNDLKGIVQVADHAPVKLIFDKLVIPARPEAEADREILSPKRLPALQLICNDFRYEHIDFGQAEIETLPTERGLHLQKLSFTSPASTLRASGDWVGEADDQSSQFNISVTSDELGKLLGMFNYQAMAIEEGPTDITINAGWPGSPADFSLAKLRGSMSLKIKEGRFTDVDPSVGRIFGILSIQALPRRLLFDWDDLFKKGTGFDKITGTFTFDNGNALTDDLQMIGTTATIDISGRAGLLDKDYDQIAVVTPEFTDSLPLASTALGPVGAAVGAGIYVTKKLFEALPDQFKALPDQIDKILSRRYTITGSWEDPVVERIGIFSQSAEAPADTAPSSAPDDDSDASPASGS